MSDHMASMADSQIEGAQSENEALREEVDELKEAYALLFKAHGRIRNALELAVRQNEHDMLMTGEELRQCEATLAAIRAHLAAAEAK